MTGYQNINNVERAYPVTHGAGCRKNTARSLYDRIIDFFCIIVMWMERPAVKFVSAGLTAVGVGAIVYFVLIGLLGGTLSFLAAAAVCVATVIVASAIFNWAE